jgi:hypothetical protein
MPFPLLGSMIHTPMLPFVYYVSHTQYSDIKPPKFTHNRNKWNRVPELHISGPCFDIRTLNETSLIESLVPYRRLHDIAELELNNNHSLTHWYKLYKGSSTQ